MTGPIHSAAELKQLQASLDTAERALTWAETALGARGGIASSFAVEDVVLIDLASKFAPSLRVFTLDTGRLHPETYDIMERVRARYGLALETYAPKHEAVEALVNRDGFYSFRESLEKRKACCGVRKVEPLGRALSGRAGWVTGLRSEQSPTRTGMHIIELDPAHNDIVKLNPLVHWSEAQVWRYVAEHNLPYNDLHDRGFRSIGCAPCTRALRPYEEARAGRWWWEDPAHKECGLHRPRS